MTPLHRIIRAIDATRATNADIARAARVSTRQIVVWRAMFRAESGGKPFGERYAAPDEATALRIEETAVRMLQAGIDAIVADAVVWVPMPTLLVARVEAALLRAKPE